MVFLKSGLVGSNINVVELYKGDCVAEAAPYPAHLSAVLNDYKHKHIQ